MKAANENANPNKVPESKSYFCPACRSALVTASGLAGGNASCEACGWKGKVEDLAVVAFESGFNSQDEIFQALFLDIRKLFTKELTQDIGRLLLKWGFLPAHYTSGGAQVDPKVFARFLGGIGKAFSQSILDTRAELEKEQVVARAKEVEHPDG